MLDALNRGAHPIPQGVGDAGLDDQHREEGKHDVPDGPDHGGGGGQQRKQEARGAKPGARQLVRRPDPFGQGGCMQFDTLEVSLKGEIFAQIDTAAQLGDRAMPIMDGVEVGRVQ